MWRSACASLLRYKWSLFRRVQTGSVYINDLVSMFSVAVNIRWYTDNTDVGRYDLM